MTAVEAVAVLKLAYAFVSTPNPIRASEQGVSPNTIDLQIIVSNPSTFVISERRIEIEIPVGEEISRDLSNTPNLPAPRYDTTIPWIITTNGSTVTIAPRSGDAGQVTAPIILSLPSIVVNQTAGSVPL